jgi:stearoyl-CoA desaturase (delta-9 desaturase)
MELRMKGMISFFFERLTTFIYYYFFLGGTFITAIAFLFLSFPTVGAFTVWIAWHFIMVTGLSVSYHRYFAHRAFRASRLVQFFLGLWGALCLQRGPLWWTSNHRIHHRFCGSDADPHSPRHGLYYSHFGWTVDPKYCKISWEYIPDLIKYPELYLIEYSYFILIPLISLIMYLCGGIWFVLAYHLAITTSVNTIASVNSVCHDKEDQGCSALNVFWVAVLGAGEGYHKNHHNNPRSSKFSQNSQFDLSYLLIRILEFLRVIRDVSLGRKIH